MAEGEQPAGESAGRGASRGDAVATGVNATATPADAGDATASSASTASKAAKAGEPARGRSPFWVRLLQRYVFAYLFIVALGLAVDVLLRSQLNSQQQDALNLLALASTVLYALALVVLLVSFSARLHLRHRRSKSIWLLYLGLAGLLVARGYFSASLLLPNVPQGNLSLVMSDLGLGAGSAIVLGMIWGVVDVAIFAARQAGARARKVRLPHFRRGARLEEPDGSGPKGGGTA